MTTKFKNIITIGGTADFKDEKLAFKRINEIIKQYKIPKKDLLVYGYEDSFNPVGAFKVAMKWAVSEGVAFRSGQVKNEDKSTPWSVRKEYRDKKLAECTAVLILLCVGDRNGGTGTISAFEAESVPVEIVNEVDEKQQDSLTPAQKRKGEVPTDEQLERSIEIYSKVAQQLIEIGCVMLDTETTGLGEYDEVVEIAVGDCKTKEIIYESFVKPTIKMNPIASNINGITDKQLVKAPSIKKVWKDLEPLLLNKIVVASHGNDAAKDFDHRLLNQSLATVGKSCSLMMYDIQPLYRMYSCQRAEGKYPLKTEGMCLQLGIKKGTHRAKADVLAQMEIMHAMANKVKPDFTI